MLSVTGWASLQQSLFAIPPYVTGNPWFIATLTDAYLGFLTFYLWVWHRSPCWKSRLVWLVLILGLGNMAMALYALLILWRLPANANLADVLLPSRMGSTR
jgi:hypothetical protein